MYKYQLSHRAWLDLLRFVNLPRFFFPARLGCIPLPATLSRTQDSINCDNKIMTFVLDALTPAGKDIVRARLAKRRLLPPTASPISDITKAGGWASLTGQELWLVSSVFPFVVDPIFEDGASLVCVYL